MCEAVPGKLQSLSCVSLFYCQSPMLSLSPGNLESLSASSMSAQYSPFQHVQGQGFSTVPRVAWCYKTILRMRPTKWPPRTSPKGTLLLFFRVSLPGQRLYSSTVGVPSAKFKILYISQTLIGTFTCNHSA